MEKNCDIDINYLHMLLDMLLGANDGTFDTDIDTLSSLIYKLENDFADGNEKYTYTAALRADIMLFDKYKDIYPFVKVFLKRGLYFSEAVEPNFKPMDISDTFDLSKKFFKQQGPFFYDKACEFLDEDAEDHLKFIEPNDNTDGMMFYLKTTGDAFVVSPNHQNVSKVSILIHELEHVIDCYNNQNFIDNYLIKEAAAMFMELISLDFLGDELSLTEAHNCRKFKIHSIIKSEANFIYSKNQYLALARKYKELNSRMLLKRLKTYGYSKNSLAFFETTPLLYDYLYQVSYLIAIELYSIYQTDKEKALNILKYIIMNGNDQNIFKILSSCSIRLNSHVEKYEDDLCLKLGI